MRPSAICRTMTLAFSGSSQMCGLPDADEPAATVWSRMRPTPWDVVMTRSWGFAAFLTSPLTQTSSPNPTSSSRWAWPRFLRSLGLGEYECSLSSPVMRLYLHVFPSHLLGELLEHRQGGHDLDGGGVADRRVDERHGE